MKFLKLVSDFFTGGDERGSRQENIRKLKSKREGREADGKKFKPKDQETLNRLMLTERRHALKVIGGSTASLLGLAGIWQAGGALLEAVDRPERVAFTRLNISTPSQLTPDEILVAQNFWKQASFDSLDTFSSDPRVARLKVFMEKNAFFPIPMGPVVTAFVGTTERDLEILQTPQAFEVVYMPPQYAKNMVSPVLTEPGGRTVRIAETFQIQEWMGILLAHELSHVWDQIVEGENSRDREQYLAGEVKAHLFERDLLKAWGPKQFERLVKEGGQYVKNNDTIRFIDIADQFFPLKQLRGPENALAVASCHVSVLFEILQREGANESALKTAYASLVSRNRRR